MNLLDKPADADLDTFPHVLLTGPHEWDPSALDYTTLPQLATPPVPLIPPNPMNVIPRLMNLAILRGEFTTLSLILLADPPWPTTNMLSKLNPLILKAQALFWLGQQTYH